VFSHRIFEIVDQAKPPHYSLMIIGNPGSYTKYPSQIPWRRWEPKPNTT